MKRLLLFTLVATLFAACSKDAINEQTGIQPIVDETPETLVVGFEDDETRIQLNEAQKTVWTKGDLVSVFYRSNANQQWRFQGETGDRVGDLKRVSAPTHTLSLPKIVVVYPYNTNYYINPESCNIQAMLPAKQTYLKDSYGLNGNIMVSCEEYNQFSLKNVCGWLKIQLTGSSDVEKITLKGNSGEQVAGEIYIDSTDGTSLLASNMGEAPDGSDGSTGSTGGNLVFDDTIFTTVTLDCGNGVALNEETATSFYIALPPQTFANGLTIEIMGTDGAVMRKTTSNAIVIERNHIQPMTAFRYQGAINTSAGLAYTTNDGYPLDPMTFDGYGATFIENMFDFNTGRGMLLFEDNVTTIPAEAFLQCTNLTWMRLPEGLTTIGNKAFYECSGMEELTIPSTVKSIGELAFGECTGVLTVNCNIENATKDTLGRFYRSKFTEVTISEGVTAIGDYAFWNCNPITKITFPTTLLTIGNYSFESCTGLREIIVTDNVTSVGTAAFKKCTKLATVTLGSAVITIGSSAFMSCSALTSITMGNAIKTINSSAFEECVKLTGVTIPYYTTTIGSRAFYNCDALTSITIPSQVTAINDYTFNDCDNLATVTIGKRVETIGQYAFYSCYKLSNLTIGNSVTSIGNDAFRDCDSLTSVTIPNGVTSIGTDAFKYCESLKTVYCKPTTPPTLGSFDVFSSNASGRTIYVPVGSGSAYKAAYRWSSYNGSIYESASM